MVSLFMFSLFAIFQASQLMTFLTIPVTFQQLYQLLIIDSWIFSACLEIA